MVYGLHPSKWLQESFTSKPYQGQNPKDAQVIVLGLDANYSCELERYGEACELVKEYHEDGVKFWHEHKVHHPFLDPLYPRKLPQGGGYHKNFKRHWTQSITKGSQNTFAL